METSASSRFGVIAAIAVIHIALIWWLTFGLSQQPLTPPTPLPAMMVELLAPPQPVIKPEPPKPQVAPQPKPEPKPKAQPKKAPPRPVAEKTPAPTPAPTPEAVKPAPAAPAPPVAAAPAQPAPPAPPAAPTPPAPQPLSPPRFNVAYLKNPLPPYPPMLRRAGQEGKVTLRVFVLTDGRAGEVKVEKSSGFPMFDEAALNTVKEWKFQPGKRGDTPEAQWVLVPINFTLN